MSTNLFDREAAPVAREGTDAFSARPRLTHLRDLLARAANQVGAACWGEPPVFFFDRKRQAELTAARVATPNPLGEVGALVAAELPALVASVELRRVARAVGLNDAARALAACCPAAKRLTELLAVPDDEVFLALVAPGKTVNQVPQTDRAGVRLQLRGAAEVWQLREQLAPLLGDDVQLVLPAAIRSDGTLPTGFSGAAYWLWPEQPLASVPRIGGERVVLVGPQAVDTSRKTARFPGLAVECELIEYLNVFQVADELSRLCGRPVPLRTSGEDSPVARAA